MTLCAGPASHPGFNPGAACELARELKELLPHSSVRMNAPLAPYTSFRIGGPADLLVAPGSLEELCAAIRCTKQRDAPLTVIGNGSNLLIKDGGLRGVVIRIAENLATVEFDGVRCRAESGALLAEVSRLSSLGGLAGLEFAAGIPGTIGGGAMMNAGAYQGELKDVVTHVTVVDEAGEVKRLAAPELEFAYRSSILQRRPWIVASVEMDLRPVECERILGQVSVNQYLRQSKQPLELPSAGSVFKRPPGRFVGPMVEALGLKGWRIGGAEVSRKHAGFIVNVAGARAADVLALIQHVRERVMQKFGVWLETEVRIIGEDLQPGRLRLRVVQRDDAASFPCSETPSEDTPAAASPLRRSTAHR